MKNKFYIIKDLLLNFISNFLLISCVQLIIFPWLGSYYKSDVFGEIVAIYGISNVIALFLGGTLNNVRLIENTDAFFKKKKHKNYQLLSLMSILLAAILSVFIYTFYSQRLSGIEIGLFVISTCFFTYRSYLTAFYRMNLEYNRILLVNIMIALGYLTGMGVFLITHNWALIFLCGELFSFVYMVFNKNSFLTDPLEKDKEFFPLLKKFTTLGSANLLSNSSNYLDRFLIVPLLGASDMAVFYAASSVTKILSFIITPMNNVFLSYLVQSNKEIKKKSLFIVFGIASICAVPIYFILNIISKFMVQVLYADLSGQAEKFIPIITLGILFNVIFSLGNPIVLRYYHLNLQIMIQFLFGLVYFLLSVYFSHRWGIWGFSLAFALSSIFKCLIQLCFIAIFPFKNKISGKRGGKGIK